MSVENGASNQSVTSAQANASNQTNPKDQTTVKPSSTQATQANKATQTTSQVETNQNNTLLNAIKSFKEPITKCQTGYVTISDSDGKIIITGKFVKVSLFKEVVSGNITQENLKTWVENLDVAYVSIAKLNGGSKPKIQRNEAYMDIISFEENEMKAKGAWANSGQPIQWAKPWIADELRNINMKPGFYSWGIIHEMAHNFDNGWRGMYSLSWDSEFFAVMVPYYVLQKNGWNPDLYDRGRALLVDQLDKAHTLEPKFPKNCNKDFSGTIFSKYLI